MYKSSIFYTYLYNMFYMEYNFKNNRIHDLRIEKNISQIELARNIGTSQANLSRWEKGIIQPSVCECWKIADYFKVSIDYLCGREKD